MSVKAMAWAWEQEVPSTLKLILVALADHADNEGICWPGQKGIGDKCGVSRKTVNLSIAKLVELNLIEAIHRFDEDGHQKSNRYQLSLKGGGCVTVGNRGCVPKLQGGVTQGNTEPSDLTVIEPVDHRNDLPPSSAGAESSEWDDAPWLLKFLNEQKTFNGNKLPKLLNYPYWSEISEAVNGINDAFLRAEFAKMALWLRENPARAPTDKGVRRFVSTWLERAASRRRLEHGNQNRTHSGR